MITPILSILFLELAFPLQALAFVSFLFQSCSESFEVLFLFYFSAKDIILIPSTTNPSAIDTPSFTCKTKGYFETLIICNNLVLPKHDKNKIVQPT